MKTSTESWQTLVREIAEAHKLIKAYAEVYAIYPSLSSKQKQAPQKLLSALKTAFYEECEVTETDAFEEEWSEEEREGRLTSFIQKKAKMFDKRQMNMVASAKAKVLALKSMDVSREDEAFAEEAFAESFVGGYTEAIYALMADWPEEEVHLAHQYLHQMRAEEAYVDSVDSSAQVLAKMQISGGNPKPPPKMEMKCHGCDKAGHRMAECPERARVIEENPKMGAFYRMADSLSKAYQRKRGFNNNNNNKNQGRRSNF